MRKLSANAQRKLRQRCSRQKIRNRFRATQTITPKPRPSSHFVWPSFMPKASLLAIGVLIFVLSGAGKFWPFAQDKTGTPAQHCRLNPRELQTKLPKNEAQFSANNKNYEVLKQKIEAITKGTPMAKMTEAIAKKDRAVAGFMVGIAMKESKFGRYAPKKNGRDCFNYWGYRGKENTTKSGYSCFDSPDHAVKVVGDKIASLVKKGIKTPAAMISWKCGSSCAGHDPASVDKWIADVAINYFELNPVREVAKNRN